MLDAYFQANWYVRLVFFPLALVKSITKEFNLKIDSRCCFLFDSHLEDASRLHSKFVSKTKNQLPSLTQIGEETRARPTGLTLWAFR